MIGNRLGLVVNARNAWPSNEDLSQMGDIWLRSIVYNFDELDSVLGNTPPNIRVIALLNSETEEVGSDYDGWNTAIQAFAARFGGRVAAVECLNEWDLLNPALVPAAAAQLANDAAAYLAPQGIATLLGSVAGPDWPNQLTLAVAALPPNHLLSGVCFHPYGKSANGFPQGYTFGEIAQAVKDANRMANGLPVYVTEFGVPLEDVSGEWGQAVYVHSAFIMLGNLPATTLAAACYFCLDDRVDSPGDTDQRAFGLKHADGTPRKAWRTFSLFQSKG